MKTKYAVTLACSILISFLNLPAQNQSWDNYVKTYDDKPGSIVVRMDLAKSAPIKEFPYLLICGVIYESENEDGLPQAEIFPFLRGSSEDFAKYLKSVCEFIRVGAFTYNFQRLEYFYIDDDSAVAERISQFWKEKYPGVKYYLDIKRDSVWKYYLGFLYPDVKTLNFMADRRIVQTLENGGDALSNPRDVDHWIYFENQDDLDKFKSEIARKGFDVVEEKDLSREENSLELHIRRNDSVQLDYIHSVTTMLRELAKSCNGNYAGWNTKLIKSASDSE